MQAETMILPPWLVRNVNFPLYEALRGRNTVRRLREYRRLFQLSPAGIRVHAHEMLEQELDFAARSLPFYEQRFTVAPESRNRVPAEQFLAQLPILTKAEIRAAGDSMINPKAVGGIKPGFTGGTTGDRLQFWVSPDYGSQNMAARLAMHELYGVRPGDSRVYLWGNPIEAKRAGLRRLRDWLINEHLLDAFRMSVSDMDQHLRQVKRLRPSMIYGYPSALTRLADHARHRYAPDDFAFLRLIVTTGEMLSAEQRTRIRAAFGCPVAAEYGAREIGLIAHECPQGSLHILTPIVHVEILNNLQPVEAGGVGEVVCTTVSNRSQPLIRYRLGDLGSLQEGVCPCGLGLPMMRLEAGKILGFIAMPDGRLCNGAVTSHVLRDLTGIVHYRTHQHELRRFTVWLQVDESFESGTTERIHARYARMFGQGCEVNVRIVDELPPDPSGKRRYVVSDVAPDYTDLRLVDEQELIEHSTGS
jgi:phenylacetate-CoA ligase